MKVDQYVEIFWGKNQLVRLIKQDILIETIDQNKEPPWLEQRYFTAKLFVAWRKKSSNATIEEEIDIVPIGYQCRTVGRSANPGGCGGHNLSPMVEIGLTIRLLNHWFTDLPKYGGNGRTPPGSYGSVETHTSSLLRKNAICMKIGMIYATDYEHTMAKSLILCGPNSNSNPK